jgi:hypothetical protein
LDELILIKRQQGAIKIKEYCIDRLSCHGSQMIRSLQEGVNEKKTPQGKGG